MKRCTSFRLGLLAGGWLLMSFGNCGVIILRQIESLLAPQVLQTAVLLPLSGFYPYSY